MLSQQHISPQTPTGATLRGDGATFRVCAPQASAVYLHGSFGGRVFDQLTDDRLLRKDERGYWTGYQDGARDGDRYRFWVQGAGSSGYKRDPCARELDPDKLSELLLHPARRRRLSLARPGFRHAGFFGHDRLPASCRHVCDPQAGRCLELPRRRAENSLSRRPRHQCPAAAAGRRAGSQSEHGL